MDFRILGRLEALDGGRDVAPYRRQPRALLALFLIHANERLPTDRIIDALWGEQPPNTADKALQGHVSTLRKLLGPSRIHTEHAAYRFEVQPGELDVERFSSAVAAARTSRDARERARQLADALGMWRGEALADIPNEGFAQPEIARLQAMRLATLEERAEVELEIGHHAELLPDLELLVGQHPLSEGLRAKLMLALYRSGRQSEALGVYRDGRLRLAEELGIDPGSELQLLERQILAQDPALSAPVTDASASVPRRQERKTVTLLVAEMVRVRPTDPEDLERTAQPMLDRMRVVVERLGGTAELVFANALLGIFGAPRAHEDDPVRAVRAAFELREMVGNGDVQLRVGIETGEALVTIDEGHVAITGDVLAAAAALQAAAPLPSIVVGSGAHRATDAVIEYQAVKSGVWSAERLGRARRAPTPDAPFIGRAEELALLERVFVRARDERSVQLATLAAEPGGGKTRLVRELRSLLDASGAPPAWRQGRCLPYGDGVTYWAIGEIVKAQAGILESDDSPTSAAKLAGAVAAVEPDETRRTWLEGSLAPLLGIEGATASGDREHAFAAWRQFLEAVAAQGPLVLVFEDIHWADEALLKFLDHLVSHASGVPLLVLCTARLELLEAHRGWGGGKRNATTIALEPLNTADTERLLRVLLGRAPRPMTIKRAGGNPLFAQELARMVGRVGSEESITVPESLQAVIAARLDTLAPELKATASDAAVVGEVFWSGALAAMAGLEERDVEARLQRLVANDVARRRRSSSVARQSEYEFLHVLVRDVAYGEIPRRDRIAKHRAAAAWIEQLAGDRVGDHAELVAHHYIEAHEAAKRLGDAIDVDDLSARARMFLTLAGERARTLDMAQAGSLYRRALALTADDDRARGRLLSRLGEVAEFTGRQTEAEALCKTAITELRAHGDLVGAAEAMVTLAVVRWRLGQGPAERRQLVGEAIGILEQAPPGRELVQAYVRMATDELFAGRAEACRRWSLKALALAESLGTTAAKTQPLHHLGIARFEMGDIAGIDDIRRAAQIGLETGLGWETATAYSDLAVPVLLTEGPSAGLALKRKAAEFALSRGLTYLEKHVRAEALWLMVDAGLWDEAVASADELLRWDEEHGRSRVTMFAQMARARIFVGRGRARAAHALERAYLPQPRNAADVQDLPPALATAAAVHHALGDGAGAIALLEELERETRGRDVSRRVQELPLVTRICAARGVLALAEAFLPTDGELAFARGRPSISFSRATLAEARGDLETAHDLHADAAAAWQTLGCPAEQVHALLGQGRCLIALERPAVATARIREAMRIARRLRARPLIEEAARLLAAAS